MHSQLVQLLQHPVTKDNEAKPANALLITIKPYQWSENQTRNNSSPGSLAIKSNIGFSINHNLVLPSDVKYVLSDVEQNLPMVLKLMENFTKYFLEFYDF